MNKWMICLIAFIQFIFPTERISVQNETFFNQQIYDVKYYLDGGNNHESNPHIYSNNQTALFLHFPEKEGYLFDGWYLDPEYKIGIHFIPKKSKGDITLYAKWNVKNYTIKFEGNGHTSGAMDDLVVSYDKEISLPMNLYKKEGYLFVGWNTKKDGSGTYYTNNGKIKNLTSKDSKFTLYAQWKKTPESKKKFIGKKENMKVTSNDKNNDSSQKRKKELENLYTGNLSTLKDVVDSVNKYRKKAGKSTLKLDKELSLAAYIRAKEIKQSGKFSHTRPNNKNFDSALKELDINYSFVGENLAMGYYTSASEVVDAWYDSAGHYENMTNGKFTRTGVAVIRDGDYYYWVQLFSK